MSRKMSQVAIIIVSGLRLFVDRGMALDLLVEGPFLLLYYSSIDSDFLSN